METRPLTPPPEPEYDALDPSRLHLSLGSNGRLRATVDHDRSFLAINVVRCFPASHPDRYWALTDQTGRVIGVIADPAKLDEASYDVVNKALARHYFRPTITRIRSVREELGAVYFDVETDHGPRSFVAKGVRDSVEVGDDGQITIVDVDDNRYRVTDWQSLDDRSRERLERLI